MDSFEMEAEDRPIQGGTRRAVLRSGMGLAAGMIVAGIAGEAGAAPAPTPAIPPRGVHELKPLPFRASRLDGLSERLIESHWSNNYGGSVRALNEINRRLAAALADPDLPGYVYNDLKREQLMRTGSVVLHELYFDNLGGDGDPPAALRVRIGDAFGDFDRWETEFRRIAAGLGGGSGWVLFGYNRQFGMLENHWMADHMHSPPATVPLLVLDMYEHSYHMDFGAAAARYVDAFFRNVNWDRVAMRMESVV